MITNASRLPCKVAAQVDVDHVRLIEPSMLELFVHPDIILDTDEAVLNHDLNFWNSLGHEFEQLGLEPSFHLPFNGLNIGSKSTEIRRISRELLIKGVQAASAAGAHYAVFHTGYSPLIPSKATRKWLDMFMPEFRNICAVAHNEGIEIVLENTWERNTDLFHIIEMESDVSFMYCLDVGHCFVYSDVTMQEWLKFYGDRIRIIHLHDNDKLEDLHLPIGSGIIDFDFLNDLVTSLSPSPRLVLEFKPRHLNPAIELLNRIFRVH